MWLDNMVRKLSKLIEHKTNEYNLKQLKTDLTMMSLYFQYISLWPDKVFRKMYYCNTETHERYEIYYFDQQLSNWF